MSDNRAGSPDARLDARAQQQPWPAPPARIVELRLQIEDYLERLAFSRDTGTARLVEAMRDSLLAGGERIRPVLALATAEALGRPPASVLPLAAALEMIHTHSLIHDDLPAIDNDKLRRGKPTAHVKFGEAVALLAGDALSAEAMTLILVEQDGDPACVLAAIAELTDAIGAAGLIGGQYLNTTAAPDLSEPQLCHVHELKTSRLLAASVEVVLTLSGETGRACAALRRFAAQLGVLFCVVDDIVDDTSLGKPHGSDEPRARRNYGSALGFDRAQEAARRAHATARRALADAGTDTSTLEQIIDYALARQT